MHQIVEYRQFSATDAGWCVSSYSEYARGQEGRCSASQIIRCIDEQAARDLLAAFETYREAITSKDRWQTAHAAFDLAMTRCVIPTERVTKIMKIVTGPAKSPRDAIRHVHVIAFEYTYWNPATESYNCRGVWRNANLARPVAETNEVYVTATEAVAAAAQAFLDTLKGAAEHDADGDDK
jgi:hypothetical protein